MKVWELESGSVNDYAPLVFASDKNVESGMFDTSGTSFSCSKKPKVEVFVGPGKKKPKPLPDISALTPGVLVMNEAGKAVLEKIISEAAIVGAAIVELGLAKNLRPRP